MSQGPAWRWSNVPLPEPHLVLLGVGLLLQLVRPHKIAVTGLVRSGGVMLALLGSALAASATKAAAGTRLESPDRLVTTGPYAFSRHPMYLGWSLVYLGVSLVVGSGWLLVLLPVLALTVRRSILREEARLEDRHGSEYRSYKIRVRRYL